MSDYGDCYRPYPNDYSSMLFVDSKPESFQLGGSQDPQQYCSPSDLDVLGFDTISPSALTDPTPSYLPVVYNDDTPPFHHMSNGLPPHINVDTSFATSSMNSRGPSSSGTAPLTPGLISPSHPTYSSSPSVLALTPPTPLKNLVPPVPDAYSPYLQSAPVSPYLNQSSSWHMSNPVCPLPSLLLSFL
jgi:hypothetical protein